jgi:hypothetical protein
MHHLITVQRGKDKHFATSQSRLEGRVSRVWGDGMVEKELKFK